MPAGGGDGLTQAISYQMKHYHPGSCPRMGKADRHRLRIAQDPEAEFRRRAYALKSRAMKVRWLLCEGAESFRGGVRRKAESFLAFVERELGRPGGGALPVFSGLPGFSGGSAPGVLSVMIHGPPSGAKRGILSRWLTRVMISGRKALCAGLAASMLFFGMSLGRGSAAERSSSESASSSPRGEMAPVSESRAPEGGLSSDLSPERAVRLLADEAEWEKEFNEAVRLSEAYASDKDPETRRKAVEAFKRAILLDRQAVAERMKGEKRNAVLSPYMTAVYELNRDAGKKKKGGAGTYLFVAGVAALGALVYFLTQKKEATEKDVTIALDVNKSFSGYQKDLTTRTAKSGSSIDIPISELGITEIDPKYVAVYSEDFKKEISFDNDGSATFTAPSNNVKYHVIVFDSLGVNTAGDQVSYGWVIRAKLHDSKRNHVVYRKDYDDQTMPERVWGGEYLPEIGANGVFDQINNALKVNYNGVNVTWGSVDRQPSATTGDFAYGAGDSKGADGYHYSDHITVNAKKLRYHILMMAGVGNEEAFEILLGVDDIGGYASRTTICNYSDWTLSDNGKKLLLFAYIKDSASFSSSSSGAAALSAAVNAVDVNKKFGPVDVGLSSGRLHAGLRSKDGSAGVRADFALNGGGLENYTTADFKAGALQGAVNMTLSPSRHAYNAQSTLTLKDVVIGVSGAYDANNRIGNVSANVGAKVGEGNIMVGVAGTPGMFGFNAQATQALKDIGVVGFRVMHTKNRLEDYTALGLDARLDKIPVNLMVDYAKFGLYENLRLGLGARILGGTLSFGLDNHAGRKNLAASYTVSIPVNN